MQMPIVCPCCNSPLMNNFKDFPINRPSQLEKFCKMKPDHQFWCISRRGCEDEINTFHIIVDMNTFLKFIWVLYVPNGYKKLYVARGFNSIETKEIPYIEPDFNNYQKLVKRLKKFLLFI